MLLNPLILISSSIKSTSCKISGLQEGFQLLNLFDFFNLKPKDDRILSASEIEIEIPIKSLNFSILKFITLFLRIHCVQ